MTTIDIFSGFLGAGKTTLIRKLIAEAYAGEKLVLIENEFGEIAIDGGFLKDAGVEITEMNSGCICCTLVGDFTKALKKVMDDFAPDRILIEPSGVGKLSDVARAVERVEGAVIGTRTTVVDAGKAKMYMRNFGEFFNDQVANADLIVMSRTDTASDEKVVAASELLKGLNPNAKLITTPWDKLSGAQIREAMEHDALHEEMEKLRSARATITTITMRTRSTSTIITIIMTTTRTSATIRSASATTITITMRTATSITIITTTPTRSSHPGAARRRASSPRRRSARSSQSSTTTRPTA